MKHFDVVLVWQPIMLKDVLVCARNEQHAREIVQQQLDNGDHDVGGPQWYDSGEDCGVMIEIETIKETGEVTK